MIGLSTEIGIGKETTWGTGVASSSFFQSADVSINETYDRLREEFNRGHVGMPVADSGRLGITGGISNLLVRPDQAGELLRAALQDPTDAGADPYTHTYVVNSPAKFSAEAALPPYSLTVDYDGTDIRRYNGGQLNQLTLTQDNAGRLIASTDFIFKGVAPVSSETPSYEANLPFKFSQLAITRAGSAFNYAESVTITINNNLIAVPLINQSTTIACVERNGPVSIEVSMVIDAKDSTTLYGDMKNNTINEWVFTWDDGTDSLALTFPSLNVLVPNKPISGAGRQTFTATGMAQYSVSDSFALEAVLTNSIASY